MGIFRDLGDWLSGRNEGEKIEHLAEEVDRYADRFDNAKMAEEAAVARDFADRIREAPDFSQAEKIFEQFEEYVEAHQQHYHEHHQRDGRDETQADGGDSELSDDS